MVKKLFKQEMIYYGRSMIPVLIILLGIALVGRFVQFFESDSWVYDIVSASAIAAVITAVSVGLMMGTLFTVVRYYKNLFTGEGYLTLTLPATVNQHIHVKLGAALLIRIVTMIVAILSIMLFLGGEWISEIYKAAAYLFKDMAALLGSNLAFYVIELLILMVISFVVETLSYYLCISIGQLFHKNRVLAAIGAYFVLYMAMQVIGTVFSIVLTLVADGLPASFYTWIESNIPLFIHLCFIVFMLILALGCIIQYLIVKWILKKRLNLE